MTTMPERVEIYRAPVPADFHKPWVSHVKGPMAQVPVVGLTNILKAAAEAAERKLPFSLVRMGDRELLIMQYPKGGSPNAQSGNFPPGWALTPPDIAALKARFADAMREADAIGLIWHSPKVTVALAQAAYELIGDVPRTVCGILPFRVATPFIEPLRAVVSGRRTLCIGLKASTWSKAIDRLGARAIPWPCDAAPSVTTEVRYNQIKDWAAKQITAEHTPCVVLVAMGPWGKPLCYDLRQLGAVVLDLGAGLRNLPAIVP